VVGSSKALSPVLVVRTKEACPYQVRVIEAFLAGWAAVGVEVAGRMMVGVAIVAVGSVVAVETIVEVGALVAVGAAVEIGAAVTIGAAVAVETAGEAGVPQLESSTTNPIIRKRPIRSFMFFSPV
jgi:hypothetical protein